MNLFEQYGIKEVADVTLYAITLDKYDNEVYIPVIYFDTLKVSSVEQSAEQTSARGGLGNSPLITWDYGKEITVNLQDAIYTPASQSLIWGGRFNLGKFKIFGAWNHCDSTINLNESEGEEIKFLCPCSLEEKTLYLKIEEEYKIPNIDENKSEYNMMDFFNNAEDWGGMPDCAQAYLESFSDFAITTITENNIRYLRYIWKGVNLHLVVLDGSQDVCTADNIDVIYDEELASVTPEYDKSTNYKTTGRTRIAFLIENEYQNLLTFYKKVDYKIPSENIDSVISLKVPAGKFFIVQDRNYFNFSKNNIIYPIDYGITNATKLDRMEECYATRDFAIDTAVNLEAYNQSQLPQYSNSPLKFYLNPITMKPYEPNCDYFVRFNGDVVQGALVRIKKGSIYYKWTRDINTKASLGKQILIDAEHYPGNFKLVGETRSRRRVDGVDERLQFEIPLCKLASNTSLNLEADGDPTVYDFKLTVMRPADGVMMKLTQYNVKKDIYHGLNRELICSNSTTIVPQEKVPTFTNCCPTPQEIKEMSEQGTVHLEDRGMINLNLEDLIPIYEENRHKIIDALITKGIPNVEIDKILPPFNVDKPIPDAFFSVAAVKWLGLTSRVPKLRDIVILYPEEDTVYTIPNDFAKPYENQDTGGVAPYLMLPQSVDQVNEWLEEIRNDSEAGRNKLIVELYYEGVQDPTYLIAEQAEEFNIDWGGVE